MKLRLIDDEAQIAAAASLAATAHGQLRNHLPFLPARTATDFVPRIKGAHENGMVMGAFTGGGSLAGFLGGFTIPDFRNLGAGFYAPEFCHGFGDTADAPELLRSLYRALAPRLLDQGIRVHAAGCYATEPEQADALVDLGFGRIVIDAAKPTEALREKLGGGSSAPVGTPTSGVTVRRAGVPDAETLEPLNADLARHIGASPVFFPDARGNDAAGWREWLADNEHIALIAEREGEALGYIKAEAPAFDVSYAVHDDATLGINGMFVAEGARRLRVGAILLRALAEAAEPLGKRMMSVDFESSNPEARGFWLRWFGPVTNSFERRL